METNVAVIVVVIIFAVLSIVAFALYRRKGRAKITGPFGMSLSIEGESDDEKSKGGIRAKDITSHEGSVIAEEATGQGIDMERVTAREDILLSSRRGAQEEVSPSPSVLSAQTLSAGGDITIQQYVSGGISTAQQVAFFLQQLGLDISFRRFAISQYEAYSNIWRKLQALRLAGDALWEDASGGNLFEFAKRLREVRNLIFESDIYLDDEHRQELREILHAFDDFRVGKERLIDIRSKFMMESFVADPWIQNQIHAQIQHNREVKERYERLLEKIRVDFRNKLATI